MSNIIQIDSEHIYQLPKAPKREDVLFVKDTKKNQYWRRQEDFPQIWYDFIPGFTKEDREATLYNQDEMLISLSHEDTLLLHRLLEREIHRRKYGVFFMNNGELTYLTGNHYFALQWGQMHGYTNPDTGEGYGEYREFQRDACYFIDIVEKSEDTVGGFIAKAKKTGLTQLLALCYLNESSMIKEKRFTMMSKSHNDATGTNMMLFQHALQLMPMILKPQLKSAPSLTKVVFDQPKTHISKSKTSLQGQLLKSASGGFKTYIEAVPTKADANDGPKVWREWLDELPKCKSPYPQEILDKGIEGVKLQQKIIGKVFITSYPPETDSKGFHEAKKIYQESSLATANEIGRTKSGLIKHFVSALNATEGTFDRYGKADQKKAFHFNESERKQQGNDRRALQRVKRQYPRTEKECWESGGSGSTFDNLRLSEQETFLEDQEKAGARLYYEGNLEWLNGIGPLHPNFNKKFISGVTLLETTQGERDNNIEGKFRFYTRLKATDINVPISLPRDADGNLMPDPNTIFAGAVDPTDYKEKKNVSSEGSNNSICVGMAEDVVRNSLAGEVVSNILVLDYLFRSDDPDELFDDVCKVIVYTGAYMIIEANKGWLVTMLVKKGFANFLLLKDSSTGVIRPYKKGDEMDLINTNVDMINDYCRAIARYIKPPVMEGEIDYLKLLKSARGIKQLLDFDPYNTQIYDWVVAFGYMRLAIECLGVVRQMRDIDRGRYEPSLMRGIIENVLDL